MSFRLSENLNPTREDLYDELYLDYFVDMTKKAYPSIFSSITEFQIIVRLMAWAVARSYQQPRILKYLYDPDLVMDELLPRLADTLNFSYPFDYPLDWLRLLIKYLQKIRRTRGTWQSVKQLIRLLEISEQDLINLPFIDYNSVGIREPEPGFIYIEYNRINDWDFANEMLRMVMPAGYKWKLESGLDTKNLKTVYRNKVEIVHSDEKIKVGALQAYVDECSATEKLILHKEWVDASGNLVTTEQEFISTEGE